MAMQAEDIPEVDQSDLTTNEEPPAEQSVSPLWHYKKKANKIRQELDKS